MGKYVKVMFGKKGINYEYKLDEVNVSNIWNPNADNPAEFGGFNYADEKYEIRWIHRGDTIYDVTIPPDAENVLINGATPIYRTNKIILSNPRKIDDDLAMYLYEISQLPVQAYCNLLGAVSIMNYKKTALRIFKDKVNKSNIDTFIDQWNDFIFHKGKGDRVNCNETVILIEKMLNEYKNKKIN